MVTFWQQLSSKILDITLTKTALTSIVTTRIILIIQQCYDHLNGHGDPMPRHTVTVSTVVGGTREVIIAPGFQLPGIQGELTSRIQNGFMVGAVSGGVL